MDLENRRIARELRADELKETRRQGAAKARERLAKKRATTRMFKNARVNLEREQRERILTEVSIEAVKAAEELEVPRVRRELRPKKTLKEYRRDARDRLLPRNRTCPRCGVVKLNSKQWVIAGSIRVCLKCYRSSKEIQEAVRVAREKRKRECVRCSRQFSFNATWKRTSLGWVCTKCSKEKDNVKETLRP